MPQTGGLSCERIGAIDSVQFLIAPEHDGIARLSSDGTGNVAVAYGGNRIRMIADTVPLLQEDDPWVDGDDPPVSAWFGAIAPHPARGEVFLDLRLPPGESATIDVLDLAGRRVASGIIRGPEAGRDLVWDGRAADGTPAPSGLYFLRIRTPGGGTLRRALLLR